MKTVTKFCLKMVQNYLPDAFILAILLTFVVFCGGMFLMNKSALQMIEYWGRGYSSMFVFGMQMVLVLLTGYVLALTPLAKKILNKVTGIPKTPQQALWVDCISIYCVLLYKLGIWACYRCSSCERGRQKGLKACIFRCW